MAPSKECIPKHFGNSNHPVCAAAEACIFFLMAQPPLLYQEGNCQPIHAFYARAYRCFFMSFATPSHQEGSGPPNSLTTALNPPTNIT